MEQLAVLRASAQRLTSTPVEELPRIAHFLASSVSSCNIALQVSPNKTSENTVPVHKLKTRLSSLLHDKTVSGRFTAAVVIKSYVETASANASEWETWLRILIGCLNKPDPWEVKRVYLSTIVRILLLCQHSPQLQREVSTPHLPAFITATLAIIRPASSRQSGSTTKTTTSPLLPCVFRCWVEVLQHYGNTIRPFVNRIKPICLSVLSESGQASSLQDLAARVLASLHRCSPKNTLQGEWDSSFKSIIKATHDTLDMVFRGVREDESPVVEAAASSRPSLNHNYSRLPRTEIHDSAGLLPWKGIREGALRAINLLRWLENMLRCSSQPATVPIGELMVLLSRLFAVIIPEISNIAQYPLRLNQEVGKEEREELWSNLPDLHTAGLRLTRSLTLLFGRALQSTHSEIANQVLDLFVAEKWLASVRVHSYEFWSSLLLTNAFVCKQVDRQSFNDLCRSCCQDLIAISAQPGQVHQANGLNTAITAAQNSALSQSPTRPRDEHDSVLYQAARELLITLLDHAPVTALSTPVRTEIDRTAVLLNDEHALFASVLNPPAIRPGQRPTPSLIPFLARISADAGNGSLAVEALLRPRMHLISATAVQTVVEEEEEEEEAHDVSLPNSSSSHPSQQVVPGETIEQVNAAPIYHHPASTTEAAKLDQSNHLSIVSAKDADRRQSDTLTKRDFATMQAGTTSTVANAGFSQQQPPPQEETTEDPLFKKAKNDLSLGGAAGAVTEKDAAAAAPYPPNTDEDIKIYSNPSHAAATTTAPSAVQSSIFVSAAHSGDGGDVDGDDSDDSEIPTLDMTMAVDFSGEDDDEDEE